MFVAFNGIRLSNSISIAPAAAESNKSIAFHTITSSILTAIILQVSREVRKSREH